VATLNGLVCSRQSNVWSRRSSMVVQVVPSYDPRSRQADGSPAVAFDVRV
jgi:hypothetical protein